MLNASGYVTARRAATVSAKVTGKIVEVLIEEGMNIKEGQILARLDDTNVKTGLDVAQAQLVSAKVALEETQAGLKQAELEFQRITDLGEAKHRVAVRPRPRRGERHDVARTPGAAGKRRHHR